MKFANIIIIGIILVIIYIVLTRIILKTNIVYDKVLDANDPEPEFTSTISSTTFVSKNSVRKNVIPNDVLNDNLTSNLMISVWFYVDNWEVGTPEKNILFVGNDATNTTVDTLKNHVMTGVSHRECVKAVDLSATTPAHKSLALSLGEYDNDLFIDIKTSIPASESSACADGDYYTRFKIENIPIQKWNCLTISIDTRLLDVYLDGKLYSSFILPGIYEPSIGNGNGNSHIYLGNLYSSGSSTASSGFVGFITRVRFEPNAINTQDAMNIYKEGINKSLLNSLFNKYSLKVSFLEYNKEKGSFSI